MKRISYISKGASAHSGRRFRAGNPAPRWRTVFIALALALAIGSAGQIPLAQAAPAGATKFQYFMMANKVRGTARICIGDNVHIDVRVVRAQESKVFNPQGEWVNARRISGVKVKGSVQDSSIGTLSPAENTTSWNRDDPGTAPFSFLAKKAGTTTISFEGSIDHIWFFGLLGPVVDRRDFVSAEPVSVTVQPCKFTVTSISYWNVPGPGNLEFVARIDEAEMTADAQGRLTGSATVNWEGTQTSLDTDVFAEEITIAPSQADLTGQMHDSGQVTVNITYQPATASYSLVAVGAAGDVVRSTAQELMTLDPLSLSVPSSGGSSEQAQVLEWTQDAPVSGSSLVIVSPEVGEQE